MYKLNIVVAIIISFTIMNCEQTTTLNDNDNNEDYLVTSTEIDKFITYVKNGDFENACLFGQVIFKTGDSMQADPYQYRKWNNTGIFGGFSEYSFYFNTICDTLQRIQVLAGWIDRTVYDYRIDTIITEEYIPYCDQGSGAITNGGYLGFNITNAPKLSTWTWEYSYDTLFNNLIISYKKTEPNLMINAEYGETITNCEVPIYYRIKGKCGEYETKWSKVNYFKVACANTN
ncbi:MAG TPA: hypothetical protein VHO70_20640 [Chitinispirillaceae bacterium]|nr:hypothetical protein [Chitinispirillaceae bacterium]